MKDFQLLPTRLQELQKKLRQLRDEGKILLQAGDVGTASAPSNIALYKYWGKSSEGIQVPANSSVSVTLDACRSYTKVIVMGRFVPAGYKMPYELPDEIYFAKSLEQVLQKTHRFEYQKISEKLSQKFKLLRYLWADEIAFAVITHNDFPTGCGLASSASGMAALAGACADLFQLEKHFGKEDAQYWINEWSRIFSGSATRSSMLEEASCVAWEKHNQHTITREVSSPLKLNHAVCIFSEHHKDVGSSEGHGRAQTSPLYEIRLADAETRYQKLISSLETGDFETIIQETERDAFAMHAVMMSSEPSLRYFEKQTIEFIQKFVRWRNQNKVQACWTLDAGPNVHLIFKENETERIREFTSSLRTIWGMQNSQKARCILNLLEGKL